MDEDRLRHSRKRGETNVPLAGSERFAGGRQADHEESCGVASLVQGRVDGGGEAACETSRMSRLSLPYAAKDLAHNLVPDPSPAVSVVVVTAVVAVASPFD